MDAPRARASLRNVRSNLLAAQNTEYSRRERDHYVAAALTYLNHMELFLRPSDEEPREVEE